MTTASIEKVIINYIDNTLALLEQKNRERVLTILANRLRKTLRKYFEQKAEEVALRLQQYWKYKKEAVGDTSWLAQAVYTTDEEDEILMQILYPYYYEAGEEGARHSLDYISSIIDRKVVYKGARSWIRDNAIRFGRRYARMITQTTNQRIREKLIQAIEEGLSLEDTIPLIQQVLFEASDYRAEMIGRTEIGRGYNMSRLIQDAKLGIEEFDWVGCNPECEICAPFLGRHTAEEIENFIMHETHPNCVGGPVAVIPEGFIPEVM